MTAMIHPWPDHGLHPVEPRPALFRGLSRAQMRHIRRAVATEPYRAGETLPRSGLDAPFVGLVLSGALREDRELPKGGSHLLALTFPGEAFAPQGCDRAKGTLTAIGDTEVLTCDHTTFEELAIAIPRLRLNLLHLVQDQLAQAQYWQLLLGRKTATERIASMLRCFHQRQGQPGEIHLPVSRAELGQLTGLTLETVSRQMRALEKAGLIAMPQPTRIRIRDVDALTNLAGDVPAHRAA
jgi:CRP/FNR family transcriptional regulator, anaerobic regulatory protein